MKNLFLNQKIMNRVLYALLPITCFSIFLFGWRILIIFAVTNFFAFLTEYLFVRHQKNGRVSMAVFVTGSLLALTLPPTIPLWIAAIGAIVAVSFGKMVFGGFGKNVFNPAIVGRAFIYIAFPTDMTLRWLSPFTELPGGFASFYPATHITSATPIMQFQETGLFIASSTLFLGKIGGSIGETSALLILFAAFYLIITKTAKWQPMVATILSFTMFSILFYGQNPLPFVLSGGILFGAVFMTTDPVSMPKNKIAIWIYGCLIGFLTIFIRKYGLFIEGFMFALLITNTFMPIIEYGLKKLTEKKQATV